MVIGKDTCLRWLIFAQPKTVLREDEANGPYPASSAWGGGATSLARLRNVNARKASLPLESSARGEQRAIEIHWLIPLITAGDFAATNTKEAIRKSDFEIRARVFRHFSREANRPRREYIAGRGREKRASRRR